MKHVWIRTDTNPNEVKHFDQGQYHDGPECMICAELRCTSCTGNWEDELCLGDLVGVDWRQVIETLQRDAEFWKSGAVTLEFTKVRLAADLSVARSAAANAKRAADFELREWLIKAINRRQILEAIHNEEGA